MHGSINCSCRGTTQDSSCLHRIWFCARHVQKTACLGGGGRLQGSERCCSDSWVSEEQHCTACDVLVVLRAAQEFIGQ